MGKVVIVLGRTVTALSTLRALKPIKKEGYKIMLATTDTKENIALHSLKLQETETSYAEWFADEN